MEWTFSLQYSTTYPLSIYFPSEQDSQTRSQPTRCTEYKLACFNWISENAETGSYVSGAAPAKRAIPCAPICQCIASATLHDMDISANLDHISTLYLMYLNQQRSSMTRCDCKLLGIPVVQPCELTSLFLRSSSHSL